MKFGLPLLIVCLSISSSAQACLLTDDRPTSAEIQALRELGKQVTNQNEMKSQIESSVWGVFLDDPSKSYRENTYSRFKIGGRSKGSLEGIIKVVTNRRNITVGTQVYNLNLRKIDKQRWTDISVPQEHLDWGPEACEQSEAGMGCKIFRAQQTPVKNLCHAAFLEIYVGCFYRTNLPKICQQYESSAHQKWQPDPAKK